MDSRKTRRICQRLYDDLETRHLYRIEPSGIMVLLNVAPEKLAPFVMALRKLACVKSAETNWPCVKLAFVSTALKKSPLLKLPLLRLAFPRLANSKIELVQMELLRLAPIRLAWKSITELRFVP